MSTVPTFSPLPRIRGDMSQETYGRPVRWSLVLLLAWPLLAWAATPDAFDTVHYHIDVTYDAATHTLQGMVSCTAVWRGTHPLDELYFFLPPNTLSRPDPREPAAFSDLRYPYGFDAATLTVSSVSDEAQRALAFALHDDRAVLVGRVPDRALLHVRLPRPYHPGERVQVVIAFATRLPEAKNWGHYRGIVALDGLWYPTLVPFRQGTWVWGLQEFVHAHYTLRLTAAADQQVLASVPWASSTQQHGWQTLTGSAGPLYHLGLSLSTQGHTEADLTHDPPLRVVVPTADAPRARHLLQTMRRILAWYRQHLALTLHAPLLTAVVQERDLSVPFSAVADHMVFVARDAVRVPALLHKLPEFVLARGLAQQWWGLRTAYNLRTERWVGEGLATYMAASWLASTYGRDRTFLAWKASWLPNLSLWEQYIDIPYRQLVADRLDQHMTTPLDETPDRQGLRQIYEKKGAMVYALLHDLLGEQAFQHFLALLAEAGSHITSADVRRAAEAASGRDLHWFFQQWVSERVWLDYAVGRVETVPHTEASGRTMYSNRVEIRRLGEAIMPLTVRLIARDGTVYNTQLDGTAQTAVVTWESAAPLKDVHLDPEDKLPDVQRLNDVYHVPYAVRPLIDFPRLDRYLLYPFVTLDNNYIDGYVPRLHLIALYLDEQAASVSLGRKEALDELSVEAQLLRNRFPIPSMTSGLALYDRQGARTVSLETSLLLRESHQQYLTPANRFTLGYQIAFLEQLTEFQGEVVPADFAPTTGRVHSIVLRYLRDTRIPTPVGAPLNVLAEPLTYGYALRLETEFAARLLGSTEPDFQQVRGEVSHYLRLWNQTSLQLRLFGGWSAGPLPLQRKLSLTGIDTLRGYPYRLQFLGDHLLGGTLSLRFPVLPDVRVDFPDRYFSLRSVHIAPFVDSGWVWNRGQSITDVSPRSSAGLRLIVGFGFASLLRFEVVADLAVPVDERGRREDVGLQAWVRLQSTVGGGLQ
jgi:Peptidase family M1 domain/Omp85 superfamily domain